MLKQNNKQQHSMFKNQYFLDILSNFISFSEKNYKYIFVFVEFWYDGFDNVNKGEYNE